MNVNYFPVTLKKGTILGHCSSISSVIRSVRSSVSQGNNLPEELEKLIDISSKDILPTHRSTLRELVKKYQEIFDIGEGNGGRTNVVQHRIDTGNARPIRQSARRLPLAKKEEADKIVSDMEKGGVIEPSDKGQIQFQWSEECQDSFKKLKTALINAPVLSYPLPDGKFILDTDASNVGLGAVLSQIQDGQEKVIGYFSKTLSKPERNYCVTRRELLAVVKGTLTESLQCSQKSSSPEVIPLEPFCEETETWDIFIKRLENFFNMKNFTGTLAEIDNKKKEWLIHSMGTKTLQLLYNLTSPDDPKTKSYDSLQILIKEHLHPKPSVIAEENRFTRRIQQEGESISDFVADLKKLSRNCDFRCLSCNASTADKHLRQQFISGLKNSSWLGKLIQLKEPDNTFSDCVQTALAMESAHKDSKEIQALQSSSMSISQNQLTFSQNFKRSSPNPFKRFCFRCGDESHLANVCKHVRSHCGRCGRVGHSDAVCRNGKPMTIHPSVKPTKKFVKSNNQNQIHPVTQPSSSEVIVENDSDDEFYSINNIIDCVLPESKRKPDKFLLDVQLDDKHVEMEYDTGAAVSSISYMFKELFPNKQIHTSELPLKTYTGEIIKPIGYSTFEVSYCGQKVLANLYILPGEVEPIFGREWLKDIKIVPPEIHQVQDDIYWSENSKSQILNELRKEFSAVFETGIGKINNYEAKLFLQDNSVPIYCSARKVPYALQKKVEDEIDRLEKIGILTKIEYSEWGTPIVPIVKKDGTIRLCADYKVTINTILKDDRYLMPNVEDIFATSMIGGKLFTTLDIREAYLHMPMDDNSAKIKAITTTKGDYTVNRLMFGTKVAPAIWQRYITRTLSDIPGVCVFLDDIKIQGSSFHDHLQTLKKVLKRLQDVGLRVREDKCKFFESKITYLGHTVSDKGLEKTPEKIQAIVNARIPTNTSELKSWLGLVNYYSRFLKNLATKLSPLYNLLQKNVTFQWTEQCQNAFDLMKREITSSEILCPYDSKLPLVLATDASPYALGAVLSHIMPDGTERPIAYASRSLSKSEKNYSQIDKEATSIFWACNKFFRYCYGRKFRLITDHKPLVSIFHPEKHLPSMVATRMLHYAQFLQGFDYEISYRSTEKHANADALSRLPETANTTHTSIDTVAHYQLQQLLVLPVTHTEIAKETQADSILMNVYKSLLEGKRITEIGYVGNDLEFSLTHGVILKGSRVVIPTTLRRKILEELHEAHTGIVKMKALARSYVWWPKIDSDIEQLVKSCIPCQSAQNKPMKVPPHCWEYPSSPWQRIHIDFAGPFMGKYFLLVIDAFSKWPEIISMTSMVASRTISILRNLFARYGLPVILVSDNGPTFRSQEFELFLKSNGILHKYSAPYHPETNGQVERYVQTMKNALRKLTSNRDNLDWSFTYILSNMPNGLDAAVELSQNSNNKCIKCHRKLAKGVQCVVCANNLHFKCANVDKDLAPKDFICDHCELPDSDFHDAIDVVGDNIDPKIFKYILKQKDELISELRSKIQLLDNHIEIFNKLNQTVDSGRQISNISSRK
ncbi:uncharacterized protein [Leptinotarsa decemlineata]|uniref:uncharacterized protein n=1 Tax=Leptinotarsa decemlineata TaxID=7539 RepID=UPI003D30B647